MNTGNAVKAIRNEMNMNQQEFAEKVNILPSLLLAIEAGEEIPNKKITDRICRRLDLPSSVLYILGMEDNDVPKGVKNTYSILYPAVRELALEAVAEKN